jgi:hypothetical protein
MDQHEEQNPDSVPVDYPETEQAELTQVATAVTWLRDLNDTIRRHGVSSSDIQALHEIKTSLEAIGLEFEPIPALEQYSVGCFTGERTSVNLTVSQEAIGQTILQTIKNWLRKIVEFLNKMVRWVRGAFMSEVIIQHNLKKVEKAILKVGDSNRELTRRFYRPDAEFEARLLRLAGELLQDPQLKRTPYQVAAFGVAGELQKVTQLHLETTTIANGLQTLVKELTAFLTDDNAPGFDANTRVFDMLRIQHLTSMELEIEAPKFDALLRQVTPAVFEQPLPAGIADVLGYDHLTKLYESLGDELRRAQRISNADEIDGILDVLSEMLQAVDRVGKIASFLYTFNKAKLNVLKLRYQYENQKFTWLVAEALRQAITDSQRNTVERLRAELTKVISDILK